MVLKRKQSETDRSILRIEICETIPNDKDRSLNELVSIIDRAEVMVNSGCTINAAVSQITGAKIKKKKKNYGAGDYC
jgi:hypothetical protein